MSRVVALLLMLQVPHHLPYCAARIQKDGSFRYTCILYRTSLNHCIYRFHVYVSHMILWLYVYMCKDIIYIYICICIRTYIWDTLPTFTTRALRRWRNCFRSAARHNLGAGGGEGTLTSFGSEDLRSPMVTFCHVCCCLRSRLPIKTILSSRADEPTRSNPKRVVAPRLQGLHACVDNHQRASDNKDPLPPTPFEVHQSGALDLQHPAQQGQASTKIVCRARSQEATKTIKACYKEAKGIVGASIDTKFMVPDCSTIYLKHTDIPRTCIVQTYITAIWSHYIGNY